MVVGLNNNYGYDKHELVTKVKDNFEYAGTDTRKGIIYDCYLVPDGITYKAVCVERKQNYCFKKEEAEQIAREKFGNNYLIDDVIITEME